MSYLLETLGRGLPRSLRELLAPELTALAGDDAAVLAASARSMPTSVDLALRLGAAHLRGLKLADAQRAYEAALQMPAGEYPAALGLACVHDELGDVRATLRYLTMAQAHDPQNARLAFATGLCLERAGQTDAAVVEYERALRINPSHVGALQRRAALALHIQDWPTALEYYEQLAADDPSDLQNQLALGAILLQLKRPDDACEVLRRALLVEPDMSDDVLTGLDITDTETRLTRAIETLEELLRRFPGVTELRVQLGDLYIKAGRDDDALHEFKTALEMRPHYLEAAVKLGTQYLRRQQYPEAAAAFHQAVELNDRVLLTFVGLGVAQHAAGHPDAGAATLDLAASLAPNSTLLYSEASKLEIRAEQDTRTDKTLDLTRNRFRADEEAASLGFESAESPPAGTTDEEEHEFDVDDLLEQAIARHERALQEHPNYADLHYRYGLLLRQVGDLKGAAAAFRAALQINPHYVKALVKLGICLRETDAQDEALELFRRALKLDPATVEVHYQLGLLFAQQAQFSLALEQFEAAVAGDGDQQEYRHQLALVLQNLGLNQQARTAWESLSDAPVGRRPRLATFD